jgi:hypothetical protein
MIVSIEGLVPDRRFSPPAAQPEARPSRQISTPLRSANSSAHVKTQAIPSPPQKLNPPRLSLPRLSRRAVERAVGSPTRSMHRSPQASRPRKRPATRHSPTSTGPMGKSAWRLFSGPGRARLRALRRQSREARVFGNIVENTANHLRTHRKRSVRSDDECSGKGSSS